MSFCLLRLYRRYMANVVKPGEASVSPGSNYLVSDGKIGPPLNGHRT